MGKAGARGKAEPHLDASCAVAACWYLFTIDIHAGGFSLPLETYLHWSSLCKPPAVAVGWHSCKGGSKSLNQLRVSSALYVLGSALYFGLVEKNCVQERMSRGLIHQLI